MAKSASPKLKYKRVLFKVSGEALMGDQKFGIDPNVTAKVAQDIAAGKKLGAQIAVVIGGGNIFRGIALAATGADRVTGDHMGMLATVINAKALSMALKQAGVDATILSAIDMPEFCETFTQRGFERHLSEGRVVVFAGGTGNPYFTTDTAAALRACEMNAEAMLKGTQVDGVYTDDPRKNPDARRFDTITYDEVLAKGLKIMDSSAVAMMQAASIPVVVYSLKDSGGLAAQLTGKGTGTTIAAG